MQWPNNNFSASLSSTHLSLSSPPTLPPFAAHCNQRRIAVENDTHNHHVSSRLYNIISYIDSVNLDLQFTILLNYYSFHFFLFWRYHQLLVVITIDINRASKNYGWKYGLLLPIVLHPFFFFFVNSTYRSMYCMLLVEGGKWRYTKI